MWMLISYMFLNYMLRHHFWPIFGPKIGFKNIDVQND
jgi:hypothetical protein